MNGETERTEESYGAVAKEEPMEDAGADAPTGNEAPSGLYFWPWPGPGNSDGGGFD